MFGNKHTYCSVKFDDEKTYWYRTNSYGFRAGMKVIVPVSNNGLWKIGTIVETRVVTAQDAPYPLTRTKGIVEKAGFFADAKVKTHNRQIERSKYPPIDISIASVKTRHGSVTYCTCARERDLHRKLIAINKEPYVLIENYPVAKESDIPREALKELNARIKRIKRAELDREIDFMELMEDLDQYN